LFFFAHEIKYVRLGKAIVQPQLHSVKRKSRLPIFSVSDNSPNPFNIATGIHLQRCSAGLAALYVWEAQGPLVWRLWRGRISYFGMGAMKWGSLWLWACNCIP